MSQLSRRHLRRTLAAACLLLPTPAALATTYDLSYQTVNLATAPYTADDTLNLSNVTFTSSVSGVTLPASLNFLSGTTTLNTSASVTFAGPLSGSAAFQQSGPGSLTLTAPSPSFTGHVTINSGSILRLTDPAALGPASSPYSAPNVNLYGTLDATGVLPNCLLAIGSGGAIANNTPTPVTIGPDLSLHPYSGYLGLGGSGDLTFTGPLPSFNNSLYKSGTGTVTYSTQTSFGGDITVSAGTLRLGIESPFSGYGNVSVSSGAALDLNGFNSPGRRVYFNGGTLVNNNTSTPSTLSTTLTGTLAFGGPGDINLTTKASTSLTKIGSGTLSLSVANPTFNSILTLNDGTLRLNALNAAGTATRSAMIYLNYDAATNAGGTLDLNGYPAPGGTYVFAGGVLSNNNTATPSPVDFSTVHVSTGYREYAEFGGDGDLLTTGYLPNGFFKLGAGALIVNTPQSLNATLTNGSLRLASSGSAGYYGSLTLYGYNVGYYYDHYGPGALLDVYGSDTSTFPALTFYNNVGVVNNKPDTTVTFTGSISMASYANAQNLTFGGDGNLVFPNSVPSSVTLNKVGAGLLVLSKYQSCVGVNLRAGTLQVEAANQLGSSVSFLGGTLRVAPFFLAPKSSYTFSPSISLDPAGGTVDTQRDTTLTGPFSGAGPLTKAGPASLTLANSPSPSIDLLVAAGTLRFSPSLPAATIGSLSISPAATLDLRNTTLTTSTPYDLLRQYLHDALLTSSSSDPTHTLGCKDTNPGTYYIQLTLTGDANLDGAITPDDYALLDRSYARSTTDAHWSDGDFNYDGIIDQNDYLLIDSTLGQAQSFSPGFLSQRESQFGATYVSQLLTSVPEPSSLLSVCGLALLPLTRRRT